MSFFDRIGGVEEKRTQLFFHDDGSFEFRKLPFQDTCLVEIKNGVIEKAFKHFYGAELRFDGYKNIHADMVTPGFGRDFILDPFDKVPVHGTPAGGKPNKTEASIKHWTAEVAESQRYKVMNKPGSSTNWDKATIFLGVALLAELIIFGISMAL